MRFRINKTFSGPDGTRYTIGDVVDLELSNLDEVWVKAGLIMQDKSLDAAPETKAIDEPAASEEPETPAPVPTRATRRRGK